VGGQVGLIVRGTPRFDYFNDWKTAYEFVYSSYFRQFTVWRGVNGNWTTLKAWTTSPAIVPNDWNTLAVVARGASLKFYINGSLVWSGSDSRIASGQAGLWTWGGGSPDEEFDVDWATLTSGTIASLTTEIVEAGQQQPEAVPANPPSKDAAPNP
jgi:hypothetical protein